MIIIIISLLIISVSWYLAHNFLRHSVGILYQREEARLKEIRTIFDSELSTIDNAVNTMVGSPWIQPALVAPSPANIEKAHSVLDRYSNAYLNSICFLLNAEGVTLATSNMNEKDNFLGNNYSFRPYFTQAAKKEAGYYFALGTTSGKRGYYSSAPVLDEKNNFSGVVVIKKDIDFIEMEFRDIPYIFLINQEGIIFSSNNTEYLFRALWPVAENKKNELLSSRQFGTIEFQPLFPILLIDKSRIQFNKEPFYTNILPIKKSGWMLISLNRFEGIQTIILVCFCLTLFFILILYFLTLVINHYKTKLWAKQEFLSEQRFKTIFKHAPGILIIYEKKSLLIRVINAYTLKMLEYTENELLNKSITLILKKESTGNEEEFAAWLQKINFLYSRTGTANEVIISAADITYEKQACTLLFANDIAKIKKAEQALVESEKLFREMLDTLPQIIFECTIQGEVVYANKYGLAYFGFTGNTSGHTVNMLDVINHDDHKRLLAGLDKMAATQCHLIDEYEFMRNNGMEFTGLVHSVPVIKNNQVAGFRGFIVDISRQKEEEAEKHRNSKLESIGILAGGLAHDFNNILTTLNNGINWINIRCGADEEIRNMTVDLEVAVSHGKNITHQLLTFSRGGAPVMETTSISALIRETADFILSGSNCKCVFFFPENLWPVDIDKAQFSQVIQNLILNAAQAMPGGGIINITAGNVVITTASHITLKEGNYLKLTVADKGYGISPAIIPKIFDPFFTTREKGSGLGLATVHSIIQRHHGHIFAESVPGEGACFTIFLPVSQNTHIKQDEQATTVIRGKGRVLIMDDDLSVLKTCSRLLQYLGYRVLTVANGTQAITAYSQAMAENDPFDVVIMDLTIKGDLGGKETLVKIKEFDKNIKAIVSSGYSNDPVMANYAEYGFAGVISKPYRLDKMSTLIDQVIRNKTGSA